MNSKEPYTIDRDNPARRAAVESRLAALDLVSQPVHDAIVTAWVSVWGSSPYETLDDIPFTMGVDAKLLDHVNEVTRTGLALATRASEDWGTSIDNDILVPILTLHDIDKPLMYVEKDGKPAYSELSREIPHGVLGAILLKELGFDQRIVNIVATHATNAPFHGRNDYALILHYADLFSADHALMQSAREPFYQKHWK